MWAKQAVEGDREEVFPPRFHIACLVQFLRLLSGGPRAFKQLLPGVPQVVWDAAAVPWMPVFLDDEYGIFALIVRVAIWPPKHETKGGKLRPSSRVETREVYHSNSKLELEN